MTTPTPDDCALVVVDYQHDFCHPEGAFGRAGHDLNAVQAIAGRIDELRAAAHAAGIPVILVRVEHSEWTDDAAWLRRFDGLPPERRPRGPVARAGTPGADFHGFEPRDGEYVLIKHRYSAFEYTELALVLRARDRGTVVIAGVQTDVCVQSTALDAVQLGFSAIVVEDAVATGDETAHRVALDGIRVRVGPLMATDAVINAWHR